MAKRRRQERPAETRPETPSPAAAPQGMREHPAGEPCSRPYTHTGWISLLAFIFLVCQALAYNGFIGDKEKIAAWKASRSRHEQSSPLEAFGSPTRSAVPVYRGQLSSTVRTDSRTQRIIFNPTTTGVKISVYCNGRKVGMLVPNGDKYDYKVVAPEGTPGERVWRFFIPNDEPEEMVVVGVTIK